MSDTIDQALPTFVSERLPSEFEFSIVSLVVKDDRYQRFLSSCTDKGFNSKNTEFLAIDNRDGNSFDGFSALRGILNGLRGRYVLFTHDDIELTADGIEELRSVLRALDTMDPTWMIAGNAGGIYRRLGQKNAHFIHIDDPYGSSRLTAEIPVKVNALDENFLVMPRNRMPLPSLDLEGFHLFATDMCLQAQMAGGTSYVIPFLLRHHGKGLVDGVFAKAQSRLERKYSRLGVSGRIQAPAILLHFGWRGAILKFLAYQRPLKRFFKR